METKFSVALISKMQVHLTDDDDDDDDGDALYLFQFLSKQLPSKPVFLTGDDDDDDVEDRRRVFGLSSHLRCFFFNLQ